MKKKKVFALKYLTENIEDEPSYFEKRMFGGLAIYLHGKMVLLLTESPGENSYRGVEYDFDIWNGLLLPTFYEHQKSLLGEFPSLVQHPVLKKWLFLKMDDPGFESLGEELVARIKTNDERFGIPPKEKKTTKKKKTLKKAPARKKAVKKKAKKGKVAKKNQSKKS